MFLLYFICPELHQLFKRMLHGFLSQLWDLNQHNIHNNPCSHSAVIALLMHMEQAEAKLWPKLACMPRGVLGCSRFV